MVVLKTQTDGPFQSLLCRHTRSPLTNGLTAENVKSMARIHVILTLCSFGKAVNFPSTTPRKCRALRLYHSWQKVKCVKEHNVFKTAKKFK